MRKFHLECYWFELPDLAAHLGHPGDGKPSRVDGLCRCSFTVNGSTALLSVDQQPVWHWKEPTVLSSAYPGWAAFRCAGFNFDDTATCEQWIADNLVEGTAAGGEGSTIFVVGPVPKEAGVAGLVSTYRIDCTELALSADKALAIFADAFLTQNTKLLPWT